MATRYAFGFLTTTCDVMRASRVTAVHVSPDSGPILVDVLLDHMGVPVPGANLATLNLAQVVMAVESTTAGIAETPDTAGAILADVAHVDPSAVADAATANDTEEVA